MDEIKKYVFHINIACSCDIHGPSQCSLLLLQKALHTGVLTHENKDTCI